MADSNVNTNDQAVDITSERLRDPELWVYFTVPRYVRVSNIQVAEAVLNCNKEIKPEQILGTQYFIEYSYWFIYPESRELKRKIMTEGNIQIAGKSFKLNDYSITHNVKKTDKLIRLSIHDVPQSVTLEEISQWVDTFAVRETEVQNHKVKKVEGNNKWDHLLTGHKYCYVSKILEQKPRYITMSITDPRDRRQIIDTPITLYYTGQLMNCSICQEYGHQRNECPDKPKPACFSCGEEGHSKNSCPKMASRVCFKCNKTGHTARFCREHQVERRTQSASENITELNSQDNQSDTENNENETINTDNDAYKSSKSKKQVVNKIQTPANKETAIAENENASQANNQDNQNIQSEAENNAHDAIKTSKGAQRSSEAGASVTNENKHSSDKEKVVTGTQKTEESQKGHSSVEKKKLKQLKLTEIESTPSTTEKPKKKKKKTKRKGVMSPTVESQQMKKGRVASPTPDGQASESDNFASASSGCEEGD